MTQAGYPPPSLDLPVAGQNIWDKFWAMEAAQVAGPRDVEAWCRLTGEDLSPEEYRIIVDMSMERRIAINKPRSKSHG